MANQSLAGKKTASDKSGLIVVGGAGGFIGGIKTIKAGESSGRRVNRGIQRENTEDLIEDNETEF